MIKNLSGVHGALPLNIQAADFGTQLVVPAGTAFTFAVIYTVPAKTMGVIRYFYISVEGTAAAAQVTAALYVNRTGLGNRLVHMVQSQAAGGTKEYGSSCEIFLNPGDIILARYSNIDAVGRAISVATVVDTLPSE